MKPSLSFEHIWEDDSMIELRVSATDGLFSAVTQIYTNWESLNEFTNRLRGFPHTILDTVEDTNGQIGGYSYFRIFFRCIDGAGHAAVEIEMEQNRALAGPADIRANAKLGFPIEPLAIDRFVAQLQAMVDSKAGSALLLGLEA
jgi:hypothetical protein